MAWDDAQHEQKGVEETVCAEAGDLEGGSGGEIEGEIEGEKRNQKREGSDATYGHDCYGRTFDSVLSSELFPLCSLVYLGFNKN